MIDLDVHKRMERGDEALGRQLIRELPVWFDNHVATMDAALSSYIESIGFDTETGEIRNPPQGGRVAREGSFRRVGRSFRLFALAQHGPGPHEAKLAARRERDGVPDLVPGQACGHNTLPCGGRCRTRTRTRLLTAR